MFGIMIYYAHGVLDEQTVSYLNAHRMQIIKEETERYNFIAGVYMLKPFIHPDIHFYISNTFRYYFQ